ncbi:MAG: hypothetical protein ABIH18_03520 [Candidatus Omnitrophota bacterium]
MIKVTNHKSQVISRNIFSQPFKKSILISLLGHITVFSMFSFSFGSGILKFNNARVSFLGAVLNQSDLTHPARNFSSSKNLVNNAELIQLYKEKAEFKITSPEFIKPLSRGIFNNIEKDAEKKYLKNNIFPLPITRIKNKPVVMLYPRLPYQFNIYFKDRQAVHIEVIFNSISVGRSIASLVKRKISSGNLEADLLTMRYISHYLFIQKPKIHSDDWQTVKIDLSTKDK